MPLSILNQKPATINDDPTIVDFFSTWSSAKIQDELDTLQGQIDTDVGSLTTHINDSTIHYPINDTATSGTSVWSSNKISTEISNINTAITANANADVTNIGASVTAFNIPKYNNTTGKELVSSGINIDGSNNLTGVGTVNGRNISADGTAQDNHIADATVHFTIDDTEPAGNKVFSSSLVNTNFNNVATSITNTNSAITNVDNALTTHKNDTTNPHQTDVAKVVTQSAITPVIGSILYYDGTSWKNVPQGAKGKVLTINTDNDNVLEWRDPFNTLESSLFKVDYTHKVLNFGDVLTYEPIARLGFLIDGVYQFKIQVIPNDLITTKYLLGEFVVQKSVATLSIRHENFVQSETNSSVFKPNFDLVTDGLFMNIRTTQDLTNAQDYRIVIEQVTKVNGTFINVSPIFNYTVAVSFPFGDDTTKNGILYDGNTKNVQRVTYFTSGNPYLKEDTFGGPEYISYDDIRQALNCTNAPSQRTYLFDKVDNAGDALIATGGNNWTAIMVFDWDPSANQVLYHFYEPVPPNSYSHICKIFTDGRVGFSFGSPDNSELDYVYSGPSALSSTKTNHVILRNELNNFKMWVNGVHFDIGFVGSQSQKPSTYNIYLLNGGSSKTVPFKSYFYEFDYLVQTMSLTDIEYLILALNTKYNN